MSCNLKRVTYSHPTLLMLKRLRQYIRMFTTYLVLFRRNSKREHPIACNIVELHRLDSVSRKTLWTNTISITANPLPSITMGLQPQHQWLSTLRKSTKCINKSFFFNNKLFSNNIKATFKRKSVS